MSITRQDMMLNLTSNGPDTTNRRLDDCESPSEEMHRSYQTSPMNVRRHTIAVHSPSMQNNPFLYSTTDLLRVCDHTSDAAEWDLRRTLRVLITVTDIVLIIGVVIVVISLCITFSTTGLAIVRMYFMENNPKKET